MIIFVALVFAAEWAAGLLPESEHVLAGPFTIIRGLPGLYPTRYKLCRPGAWYKIIT